MKESLIFLESCDITDPAVVSPRGSAFLYHSKCLTIRSRRDNELSIR